MSRRPMTTMLAAALLLSCSEEGPRIDVESSVPVRVEAVARHPIAEYVTATSTVQAQREAQLRSLQAGRYERQTNPRTGAAFAMGDQVDAGALLALLVNPELVNQVSMESKKLSFTSAQREFDKQQGLLEKGGITVRELAAAERSFVDARYALENAELQLAKLEVRVPFAGRLVDLTHYSDNALLEAGAPVGVVMDYDELYAEVSLPGKQIDRIAPQQLALVTHYGDAVTDTLQGRIDQVSPVMDRESRMFKVVMTISNDSLAIRPGMFVKVDIVVAAKDSTLVIPKEVILDRGDSKVVFVVEKGIALERRLETGLSNREQIEVLSGLEVGDRLVVEGFETLRNQSKVKLANETTGH
ncbi:MAG: efflux RND transporter periplasmic adaptor subunit [Gemmatimonadetes bacterium]|jgi:membrane fusion protein, multidrug efflux system|nr:efflux RND transporter periplasmic adaptor subunit [Gemmatimonadota bacterium]